MKKPYVEPKMTVENFDDMITTAPRPTLKPIGSTVSGNGIIFEDEEY